MGKVEVVNHADALIQTLPGVIQDYTANAAHSLAEQWQHSIPDDAPAAAAQREGIYVRTPSESGYSQAVSGLRNLFSGGLDSLFAATLAALFSDSLSSLFAPDLTDLVDPLIAPEVPAPAAGTAVVASATGWSQPEHWRTAMNNFDHGAALSGFFDEWLSRSGVS